MPAVHLVLIDFYKVCVSRVCRSAVIKKPKCRRGTIIHLGLMSKLKDYVVQHNNLLLILDTH